MQKGLGKPSSAFISVIEKPLFPTIGEKNSSPGLNTTDFMRFHGMQKKSNTKANLIKLKDTNKTCNVRTNQNLICVLIASESGCNSESTRLTLA